MLPWAGMYNVALLRGLSMNVTTAEPGGWRKGSTRHRYFSRQWDRSLGSMRESFLTPPSKGHSLER